MLCMRLCVCCMRVLYACAGATYACAVHYVLLMCAGVEGSAAVYAESACC